MHIVDNAMLRNLTDLGCAEYSHRHHKRNLRRTVSSRTGIAAQHPSILCEANLVLQIDTNEDVLLNVVTDDIICKLFAHLQECPTAPQIGGFLAE